MQIKQEIILDFGSGNTCKNDKEIIKEMIDNLKKIDSGKFEIIIKWQLFKTAGENIPLNQNLFVFAIRYAKEKGYKTTASVFDVDSLNFLLGFKDDIPFIKIANNENYYSLIDLIPRGIPVYCSIKTWINRLIYRMNGNDNEYNYRKLRNYSNLYFFCCISKYPAEIKDYEVEFCNFPMTYISDHTIDFSLFNKYKPNKIEWHYKLQNSTGLDAGEFSRTPDQLKEIL